MSWQTVTAVVAALSAFIEAGVFDAADEPDDEFIFGLDRILDGIAVLAGTA